MVDQRRLAVVDVGDDRDVAYVFPSAHSVLCSQMSQVINIRKWGGSIQQRERRVEAELEGLSTQRIEARPNEITKVFGPVRRQVASTRKRSKILLTPNPASACHPSVVFENPAPHVRAPPPCRMNSIPGS